MENNNIYIAVLIFFILISVRALYFNSTIKLTQRKFRELAVNKTKKVFLLLLNT